MTRPFARALLSLVGALALAGCGGGGGGSGSGGGGGGGGPPPPTGPTATIVFPPTSFLTDTASMPLFGTAADVDGVQSVTVNGVAATSGNAFLDWDAVLDTPLGDSPVTVDATDMLGTSTPGAATLPVARNQGPMIASVRMLAYDTATGRILYYDYNTSEVDSVDPGTHVGTLVANATKGSGVGLANCNGMAVASSLGKLYITRGTGVLALNLATGDRVYATGNGVGSGPTLTYPFGVAVDAAGGVGYVDDPVQVAVYRFDLATGARTLLSGGATGAGPAFDAVNALAVDPAGGRLFVVAGVGLHSVYAVDLVTGDRSLVSGGGVGTGPSISLVQQVQWDAAHGRLVIAQGQRQVLSVDPATGNRTDLSNFGHGALVPGYSDSSSIRGLALDPTGSIAWTHPVDYASLVAVDLTSGDWTEVYRPAIGSGPLLANIRCACFDPTTSRELVFAYAYQQIIAVNLSTGGRTAIVAPGVIHNPNGIAVDAAHGRAITVSFGQVPEIYAVDLSSGATTLLSGTGVGAGPLPQNLSRLAVDAAGATAYATDAVSNAVFAFDLATGDRQIIADAATGTGPTPAYPNGVALDDASNTLFFSDYSLGDRVVAINLATLARTVVSGAGVGSGPILDYVGSITFDPATGLVLVGQNHSILSIDPLTGARTTLANNLGVGTGATFDSIDSSVDVDPATGFLWVTEQFTCRLLVVDPSTGDRVVVSK